MHYMNITHTPTDIIQLVGLSLAQNVIISF